MSAELRQRIAARDTFRRAMLALALATSPIAAQQRNVAPAPPSARGDTLVLDLARSISVALERATPIQAASDSTRLSGIAMLESYGRFLPSVTTTVGGFHQQGYTLLSSTALVPADARFYGMGYTVSAGVNLFNGFRDREHLRAALKGKEAATANLDRARQQVAFDVAQTYYRVVLDRRLTEVATSSLALSRTRESQLSEQVKAGTRAPPDLYRQQAQTYADEVSVIDAQNRERNDETALLRRLRIDPTRPLALIDPVPDTVPVASEALLVQPMIVHALGARPDLVSARARLAADEREQQVARGISLPKLNLRLDLGGSGRFFGQEMINGTDQLTVPQRSLFRQLGDQRTSLLSLGLSWDLFDGYRARLDVERASVTSERDRLAEEDLRLRISGEVQQALDDYHAAAEKLHSTAAGLVAAERAFEAVQGRFDVGLASFVDVVTSQTALTQARSLREQAVANFALQKAVLRYVGGESPTP